MTHAGLIYRATLLAPYLLRLCSVRLSFCYNKLHGVLSKQLNLSLRNQCRGTQLLEVEDLCEIPIESPTNGAPNTKFR